MPWLILKSFQKRRRQLEPKPFVFLERCNQIVDHSCNQTVDHSCKQTVTLVNKLSLIRVARQRMDSLDLSGDVLPKRTCLNFCSIMSPSLNLERRYVRLGNFHLHIFNILEVDCGSFSKTIWFDCMFGVAYFLAHAWNRALLKIPYIRSPSQALAIKDWLFIQFGHLNANCLDTFC